ncbi:antitermination protein [Franconibacter helveticus]|uniref:antitermination protein n=1 Tax=Franconibacter helveticus TaxID=357240 RepID=UPI000DA196E4|nr:antitermination protein [Franconibacter helveticus]
MNLEALPKFYSPKSPKLNDATPATGGDALTITDVMAAQGFVQSQASFGFSLFLSKMGIQDPQSAIDALFNYALALKNPVLNKLSEKTRIEVIACLVRFAYADYSRSAASKSACPQCEGEGQVSVEKVTRKVTYPWGKAPYWASKSRAVRPSDWERWTEVKSIERVKCDCCNGKGELSTACRGCKGKGTVLDEKRTRLLGVPVQKVCGRCNGNRFSRIPTSLARSVVEQLVPDLTKHQWYSGYAEVIDKLVTKCWQEEAYAEKLLREVTR